MNYRELDILLIPASTNSIRTNGTQLTIMIPKASTTTDKLGLLMAIAKKQKITAVLPINGVRHVFVGGELTHTYTPDYEDAYVIATEYGVFINNLKHSLIGALNILKSIDTLVITAGVDYDLSGLTAISKNVFNNHNIHSSPLGFSKLSKELFFSLKDFAGIIKFQQNSNYAIKFNHKYEIVELCVPIYYSRYSQLLVRFSIKTLNIDDIEQKFGDTLNIDGTEIVASFKGMTVSVPEFKDINNFSPSPALITDCPVELRGMAHNSPATAYKYIATSYVDTEIKYFLVGKFFNELDEKSLNLMYKDYYESNPTTEHTKINGQYIWANFKAMSEEEQIAAKLKDI